MDIADLYFTDVWNRSQPLADDDVHSGEAIVTFDYGEMAVKKQQVMDGCTEWVSTSGLSTSLMDDRPTSDTIWMIDRARIPSG